MSVLKFVVACTALAVAGTCAAQAPVGATPQNVLQLSAQGAVDVQQDVLRMTLVATRDGTDAAVVQSQLKSALDGALAEAKKQAQPGELDVRTGNFNLSPRYTREGKINGWQGRAELVLEGRDFPRIAQAAGRITTLSVEDVSFQLSREQRKRSEAEAQKLAIDSFRQKAAELARGFGFADYSLREVSVSESRENGGRPRMMAAQAKSFASDAPVPVEAGKTSVVVTVSGSVQLR